MQLSACLVAPIFIHGESSIPGSPGDLLQSTNFCASASLQGRVSRQLGSAPNRMSVFTWKKGVGRTCWNCCRHAASSCNMNVWTLMEMSPLNTVLLFITGPMWPLKALGCHPQNYESWVKPSCISLPMSLYLPEWISNKDSTMVGWDIVRRALILC